MIDTKPPAWTEMADCRCDLMLTDARKGAVAASVFIGMIPGGLVSDGFPFLLRKMTFTELSWFFRLSGCWPTNWGGDFGSEWG